MLTTHGADLGTGLFELALVALIQPCGQGSTDARTFEYYTKNNCVSSKLK